MSDSEYVEPEPVPGTEPDVRPHSAAPVAKVTAATAGAALATIIVVLLEALTDIEFAAGLEGALATVFAFVAGFFAPPAGTS